MFKAYLYKCKDDNRKINKTLEDEIEIGIDFNRSMNFSNGEIILQGNIFTFSEYNYLYIPYFKRYFYITDMEATRNNLIKFNIKIDVLMTYKDSIVQLVATSIKSDNYEPYTENLNLPVSVKEQYKKLSFENPFNENGTIILVALGN